jgi:hypothetical protein
MIFLRRFSLSNEVKHGWNFFIAIATATAAASAATAGKISSGSKSG